MGEGRHLNAEMNDIKIKKLFFIYILHGKTQSNSPTCVVFENKQAQAIYSLLLVNCSLIIGNHLSQLISLMQLYKNFISVHLV